MTAKMIDNRVKKLQEIEAQQKELDAAAKAIRAELENEMTATGTDELNGKDHRVTWREIISERLDTKALKKDMPAICKAYSITSTTRRFLIA